MVVFLFSLFPSFDFSLQLSYSLLRLHISLDKHFINDSDFHFSFLEIAKQFSNTEEIQNSVLAKLVTRFSFDEQCVSRCIVFKYEAAMELKGRKMQSNSHALKFLPINYEQIEQETMASFENAIQVCP